MAAVQVNGVVSKVLIPLVGSPVIGFVGEVRVHGLVI